MSAQAAAPYPLTFSIDYPDRDLNRVTTGFRLILAIPLLLLLALFGLGRPGFGGHPLGGVSLLLVLFDFVVGVMRWSLRVTAYAFLLVTDRYPPFSLAP